jgi:hypothetical protein
MILVALPNAAVADPPITAGDGTAGSCTEDALRSAVDAAETGGGAIRFRCGKEPVTISLTVAIQDPTYGLVALSIPDNTTIDGGGLITLEGAQAAVSLLIRGDARVVLSNLSVVGGSFRADLIRNSGHLTIDNSRFVPPAVTAGVPFTGRISSDGELIVQNSVFSNLFPFGAVLFIENNGFLRVSDSAFLNNQPTHSVIESRGAVDVKNTVFSGNRGGGAGAILSRDGATSLVIDNSDFSDNRGNLGAAAILSSNPTVIKNSTFSGNFGSERGAISAGPLTVIHCKIFNNFSQAHGGGIAAFGPLEVVNSEIFDNRASSYGGGIAANGSVRVTNSIVTTNSAPIGGGIYTVNEAPTLIRTTVTDNTPDDIFIRQQ